MDIGIKIEISVFEFRFYLDFVGDSEKIVEYLKHLLLNRKYQTNQLLQNT